jgi:hypothetical protein
MRLNDAFFEIFRDYLEASTSVSAADAAQALDNLVPEDGEKEGEEEVEEKVEAFIWDTWNNFFQTAQQIPYDHLAHDKLARVLRELALLPEGGKTRWQTLPQFSWVAREWFNFAPSEKHVKSENTREVLESWVNLNAFLAKLGGSGIYPTADFAIWMLRQALEDEDKTEVPKLADCHVLAAAQYVEYEGHILLQQLSLGWKPLEKEAQMFRGGPLFDGEPGLTNERWIFWISRFEELANKTSTEAAKSAALRAAKLLEIWQETKNINA